MDVCTDDNYILTIPQSNDSLVQLWSIEDMKVIMNMQNEGKVTSAKFSPDGNYIIIVSNNYMKLWSIKDKQCIHTIQYKKWIRSAEFSSDGKHIVTADLDNEVLLWHTDRMSCIDTISFEKRINCAEFGVNSSYVIINYNGNRILRKNGVQLNSLCDTNNYRIIEFSDDNIIFISESGQPYLKLLSLENGIIIDTINKHKESIGALSISPNGNCFLTFSGLSKTLSLWSTNGEKQWESKVHDSGINSASFSPNGVYIVTASEDKTSKIWSVETGVCLMTINHKDNVNYASFTPDGKYIITASGNVVRKHKLTPLPEILSRWSEILGPNAELTKEEKARYFLN